VRSRISLKVAESRVGDLCPALLHHILDSRGRPISDG
jgi:hypothetical protein